MHRGREPGFGFFYIGAAHRASPELFSSLASTRFDALPLVASRLIAHSARTILGQGFEIGNWGACHWLVTIRSDVFL
jgi:hypothetical protein